MFLKTKFELMNAFLNGEYLELTKGRSMVINKIEREDGSNHSYNVYGQVNGKEMAVYVKTTD